MLYQRLYHTQLTSIHFPLSKHLQNIKQQITSDVINNVRLRKSIALNVASVQDANKCRLEPRRHKHKSDISDASGDTVYSLT